MTDALGNTEEKHSSQKNSDKSVRLYRDNFLRSGDNIAVAEPFLHVPEVKE